MAYQALYRKYRPQLFADVLGQEHITTTLRTSFVTSSFARKRNGTPFFSAERSVSQ